MPAPYQLSIQPEAADIDTNNHVNNIVYVRWLQEIATSHWTAIAPQEAIDRFVWVIRRQEIDYIAPCFAHETLQALTWGENPRGASFERCTTLTGPDGKLRLQARTTWVILDRELQRPARLRPELIALFLRD